MKKLLASTAIAGLGIVLSVAAFALDNAGTQVEVKGDVHKTCHFGGTPVVQSAYGSGTYTGVNLTATSSIINISNFVDPATAFLKGGAHIIQLDFPNVYCNAPFTLDAELDKGYLRNPAAKNGNFIEKLHYEFKAKIGASGPSVVIESPQTVPNALPAGATYAYNGTLNVDFIILAGSSSPNPTDVPLLAGDFTDTATITISAVP